MAYKKDWSEYYKLTRIKPPRDLLIRALEYVENKGSAIDIGGGALRDTRYLLEQGFDTTVIDKSLLLQDEAKEIKNDRFRAITASFEEFDFPKNSYDIASAMYSLPFCNPIQIDEVLEKIRLSLKQGGVFCGQLFGERDGWAKNPKMVFHTKQQALAFLQGFEIIFFQEEEKDDISADGEVKHWHIFNFIVRK